ncbi:MAG: carbamoyltransferase HypF [Bryobacteraceae bacterium]
MTAARSIRVRGVVQGVGFRPFVFRLAHANSLAGWVLNEEGGVDIHLEGTEPALDAFLHELEAQPPPAAQIAVIDVRPSEAAGLKEFTIRESRRNGHPSVRISPDLPVCEACLAELFDPADSRYLYPYINCTNCGPRYTVIESLPYDRSNTTMKRWPLDLLCAAQYHDPTDRRFHAQPVACPVCGPHYYLDSAEDAFYTDAAAIKEAARLLKAGHILVIKGIGGYHLACDARNETAVRSLRERKYRKEKPFAVMVRTVQIARSVANLSPDAEALLTSPARPIVLTPVKIELPAVAPENDELGLMLPYAPLHHLLFAMGAPEMLVMTSANRSSEPIAYDDSDARQRLGEIADAFLAGERPIARRVDDSVTRAGVFGPVILRRSRGYAPGAVATIPIQGPVLALGADLKNTITLVVNGQAFVSQHIGDLDHYDALKSFQETIQDLVSMYEVNWEQLLILHDRHPQYASTAHALELPAPQKQGIQHHRAHIASVLAEKEAWHKRVIGVSFDGTGYGDDGSIWGGEFFVGSMTEGFQRMMHLRKALLPGGDASSRHPVQCAAGFLAQIDGLPDFAAAPFRFPARYEHSLQLVERRMRTFETTSVGRLFDAAAALLGFVREVSFEGQAAIWLEHIARRAPAREGYPFPIIGNELDFRPLLGNVARDRLRGRDPGEIARAFQSAIAESLCAAAKMLCEAHSVDTIVLSGGVFQNELLLRDVKSMLSAELIQIWTNAAVPSNDGGISLGQAALGAFARTGESHA